MRLIKFRAWDGNNMLNDFAELHTEHYWFQGEDADEHPDKTIVDVMQFTGMQDKNGHDIYEHDIVKQRAGLYVVEWHDYGWHIRSIQTNRKTSLADIKGKLECMGTIHTNPELLLKAKK